MKVTYQSKYRNANGNVVRVYSVSGTDAEILAYSTAKGEYHRKDDKGNALFFTTRNDYGLSSNVEMSKTGMLFPVAFFEGEDMIGATKNTMLQQALATKVADKATNTQATQAKQAVEASEETKNSVPAGPEVEEK